MSVNHQGPPDDARDQALLDALQGVWQQVDPAPDHVREAARGLWALRDLDSELMEAVVVDEGALQPVRSGSNRMHFFEFGQLSLDLEITCADGLCELIGVLAHPDARTAQRVSVLTPTATFCTEPDDAGRFVVAGVPPSMVRIRLDGAEPADTPLTTPWFDVGA